MPRPKWPVVLNDGTILSVYYCGASDGVLWMDGIEMSIMDCASLFANTSVSSKIIAYGDIEHLGYTKVVSLSLNDGVVKVALRRD